MKHIICCIDSLETMSYQSDQFYRWENIFLDSGFSDCVNDFLYNICVGSKISMPIPKMSFQNCLENWWFYPECKIEWGRFDKSNNAYVIRAIRSWNETNLPWMIFFIIVRYWFWISQSIIERNLSWCRLRSLSHIFSWWWCRRMDWILTTFKVLKTRLHKMNSIFISLFQFSICHIIEQGPYGINLII